jgi:hypothetical protein
MSLAASLLAMNELLGDSDGATAIGMQRQARGPALAAVLLAIVLPACASRPYRPGSFELGSRPFEGTYAELDCLDVAVSTVRPPRGAAAAIVLTYGNRCADRVTVDVRAMQPRGLDVRGHDVPLRFVDAARRPAEASLVSREVLALERVDAGGGALSTICVDVAALEASLRRSDRICVATPDGR